MTPQQTKHQALLQVVGEMWHELQKFEGKYKRVSIQMEDFMHSGSAGLRAEVDWFDDNKKCHRIVSRIYLFSDLPEFLDTTMLFRELQNEQRKKI